MDQLLNYASYHIKQDVFVVFTAFFFIALFIALSLGKAAKEGNEANERIAAEKEIGVSHR